MIRTPFLAMKSVKTHLKSLYFCSLLLYNELPAKTPHNRTVRPFETSVTSIRVHHVPLSRLSFGLSRNSITTSEFTVRGLFPSDRDYE